MQFSGKNWLKKNASFYPKLFYTGPVTSDEQKDADCESTK